MLPAFHPPRREAAFAICPPTDGWKPVINWRRFSGIWLDAGSSERSWQTPDTDTDFVIQFLYLRSVLAAILFFGAISVSVVVFKAAILYLHKFTIFDNFLTGQDNYYTQIQILLFNFPIWKVSSRPSFFLASFWLRSWCEGGHFFVFMQRFNIHDNFLTGQDFT